MQFMKWLLILIIVVIVLEIISAMFEDAKREGITSNSSLVASKVIDQKKIEEYLETITEVQSIMVLKLS